MVVWLMNWMARDDKGDPSGKSLENKAPVSRFGDCGVDRKDLLGHAGEDDAALHADSQDISVSINDGDDRRLSIGRRGGSLKQQLHLIWQ